MGTVKHKKTDRSLTYGKLCQKAAKLQVPKDPPLKNESEFRYMGKPMPRVDIPEKVAGKAIFGLDVNVPGYALCCYRTATGLWGKTCFVRSEGGRGSQRRAQSCPYA